MYVSYEYILICLIVVVTGLVKIYRLGVKDGIDDSYDMGYEACMKDYNYSPELQREFEDFLYEKGYVVDKSLTDVKTLKPVNKQNL